MSGNRSAQIRLEAPKLNICAAGLLIQNFIEIGRIPLSFAFIRDGNSKNVVGKVEGLRHNLSEEFLLE